MRSRDAYWWKAADAKGPPWETVHLVNAGKCRACRVPVSTDPPVRERRLQQDGQPRIKVPGLADRVWADTRARIVITG